jgi:hypothetical protein
VRHHLHTPSEHTCLLACTQEKLSAALRAPVTLHQRVSRKHTSQPGMPQTGVSASVSLYSATAEHMHHTAVGAGKHLSHKASLGRAGSGQSRHSTPQLVVVLPRLTPESGPRTARRSLVANCTLSGSQDPLRDNSLDKCVFQRVRAKRVLRSAACAIAMGGTVLTLIHLDVILLGRLHDRFSPHPVLTHGAQPERTGWQGRPTSMSPGGTAHWGRGGRRGGQTGAAIAGSCGGCGSKTQRRRLLFIS